MITAQAPVMPRTSPKALPIPDISSHKRVSATVADNAALTTLYADMGKEITAALCRMGGETVGLVALNGKLTADGARKAARLVSFCDSFSIPVVTLVDSEGVEYADAANAFAKLAKAYVTATTAKITGGNAEDCHNNDQHEHKKFETGLHWFLLFKSF